VWWSRSSWDQVYHVPLASEDSEAENGAEADDGQETKSSVMGWRFTGRAECKYRFFSTAIMTQNVRTSLGIRTGCGTCGYG
jgi:hypothetical protein